MGNGEDDNFFGNDSIIGSEPITSKSAEGYEVGVFAVS
jgi:hypothetical protein